MLGIVNGLLALVAVNAAYSALNGSISLVPIWAALPPAAFTAWRAGAYVRALLDGAAHRPLVPLVEGFCLMACSTVAYGVYINRHEHPFDSGLLVYAVFALPVGCFGIAIAGALVLLNQGALELLRRRRREPRSCRRTAAVERERRWCARGPNRVS